MSDAGIVFPAYCDMATITKRWGLPEQSTLALFENKATIEAVITGVIAVSVLFYIWVFWVIASFLWTNANARG